MSPTQASALAALAARQSNVVSAAQSAVLALERGWVRAALRGGRWQRVHPGVYAVHNGPVSDLGHVWSAVLYAGEGAVASHATAAWL